ncbi:hypothetical protein EJ063_07655 [Vibrio aquaticus]|uniref:Uncharacterized protein n=1 Tax=Vibrio aquaticus TaxID=2496559 RepID=A0A3S0QEB1_9VIBR|nr:hypothetical protein [Vibrio aquaticus]RTZ16659.1 hypothetical protein EJ063_07655 [Vibrio aquaticus]
MSGTISNISLTTPKEINNKKDLMDSVDLLRTNIKTVRNSFKVDPGTENAAKARAALNSVENILPINRALQVMDKQLTQVQKTKTMQATYEYNLADVQLLMASRESELSSSQMNELREFEGKYRNVIDRCKGLSEAPISPGTHSINMDYSFKES